MFGKGAGKKSEPSTDDGAHTIAAINPGDASGTRIARLLSQCIGSLTDLDVIVDEILEFMDEVLGSRHLGLTGKIVKVGFPACPKGDPG